MARLHSGSTAIASTALDVCCVMAFVAIGRRAHHDGDSVAGIWHTAWPFLAGLAIGLVAARGWRRPLALVPAGLGAWLGAAAAGMGLRVVVGQEFVTEPGELFLPLQQVEPGGSPFVAAAVDWRV